MVRPAPYLLSLLIADLLNLITGYLSPRDMCRFVQVCKRFAKLYDTPDHNNTRRHLLAVPANNQYRDHRDMNLPSKDWFTVHRMGLWHKCAGVALPPMRCMIITKLSHGRMRRTYCEPVSGPSDTYYTFSYLTSSVRGDIGPRCGIATIKTKNTYRETEWRNGVRVAEVASRCHPTPFVQVLRDTLYDENGRRKHTLVRRLRSDGNITLFYQMFYVNGKHDHTDYAADGSHSKKVVRCVSNPIDDDDFGVSGLYS